MTSECKSKMKLIKKKLKKAMITKEKWKKNFLYKFKNFYYWNNFEFFLLIFFILKKLSWKLAKCTFS